MAMAVSLAVIKASLASNYHITNAYDDIIQDLWLMKPPTS
jgi:hypothetical protein